MTESERETWARIAHLQRALRLYWIASEIDDPDQRAVFDGFLVNVPGGEAKRLTDLTWDDVLAVWRGLVREVLAIGDRRVLEDFEAQFTRGGDR